MQRWNRLLLVSAIVLGAAAPARGQEAVQTAVPPPKPKACVIDLDGTIANETARREKAEKECPREKDKNGFYAIYFDPALIAMDAPIVKSREVLSWVDAQGVRIYYVSSRNQGCLDASRKWIEQNGFPKGARIVLQKRPQKSVPFKTEAIKEIQGEADVLFGVGDRDSDIEAYGNCGIKAIKVEVNSDKDWERVRTEIEKVLAEKK
jgi:predicted secreted acid phosphatase